MQEAAESVSSLEFGQRECQGWRLGRDGWAAAERSLWALGVVVVHVHAQDAVEVARADDQQPVQALGACGPDEALGVRVGLCDRNGVWITLTPSVRKTSSNPPVNFESVADQERHVAERSGEAEVACLLGDPAAVWIGRSAREVDAARLQLDEEQHVAAQQRGLDGEEVAGDDACRLARRNSRQQDPERLGGGPGPVWASSRRTVFGETRTLSLLSSPAIR